MARAVSAAPVGHQQHVSHFEGGNTINWDRKPVALPAQMHIQLMLRRILNATTLPTTLP